MGAWRAILGNGTTPTNWGELIERLKPAITADLSDFRHHALGNNATPYALMENEDFQSQMEEFRSKLFTYAEPSTLFLICLYIPLFLVASFGNCAVCLVVLAHRQMRNVTNCFIVNLAIADVLVILVGVPMAIGQSVYRIWIYGEFMCKFSTYMQGITVAASVLTIMALSGDRFLVIRYPMVLRGLSTGRYTRLIVLVTWLFSGALMLPILLVRQVYEVKLHPDIHILFCHEVWRSSRDRIAYDLVLFLFLFVIPGCSITACYTLIGCKLWTQDKDLLRNETAVGRLQSARILRQRRSLAKTLVILAALFGVCWLPYHSLNLYLDFVERERADLALSALPFTLLLGHSNSAFNPLLYCFLNKTFRRYVSRMLNIRQRPKRRVPSVNLVVRYVPVAATDVKSAVQLTSRPSTLRPSSATSSTSRATRTSTTRSSTTTSSSLKSTSSGRAAVFGRRATLLHLADRKSVHLQTDKSVESRRSAPPSLANQQAASGDGASKPAHPYSPADKPPRVCREALQLVGLEVPTTISEESSWLGRSSPSPVHPRPRECDLIPENDPLQSAPHQEEASPTQASSGALGQDKRTNIPAPEVDIKGVP